MPIELVPPPGSVAGGTTLEQIIQFVITLLFVLGVIFAIAFLIFGGIKWIISGGNKEKVEAARNHIVAAIIGLVIIVTAFVIFAAIFQILGARNPITEGLCIPTLQHPFCPPTQTPTPPSPPAGGPTATPSAVITTPQTKAITPTIKATPMPTCKPRQKPTSKGGFASCT